ncbi:MAG: transglycosylase SLT domain-containing protein [Xanthomonadales bacterium]|nr:transglycosylase SLT domain-containing protein [Xanthomonadales bacterium]
MTPTSNPFLKLSLNRPAKSSTGPAAQTHRRAGRLLALCLVLCAPTLWGAVPAGDLEQFKTAWAAAGKGDHASFARIKDGLTGYLLYPYLQYEDYRNRRAGVDSIEMAAFLDAHRDWAFEPGLRRTWLKALAQRGRWSELLAYSNGVDDTALQCQVARARIILGQTSSVKAEIQRLWTVGRSQPDECDVPFTWLIKNGGISEKLAWERIYLAMAENNRSLVRYLARFVPSAQRRWLDDWRRLSSGGFAQAQRLTRWQNNRITREIAAISIRKLARRDATAAAEKFEPLAAHFNWDDVRRNSLWRDIALYSAVMLEDETASRMQNVPMAQRDSQLLEWWARFLLSTSDWKALPAVIGQMPAETRNDDRWQYWLAQARLREAQGGESHGLRRLASKANYYGFLSADEMGLAYNICPLQADIDTTEIGRIAGMEGFRRALELRKAGLDNWAVAEWSLAAGKLDNQDLAFAAALANSEGWHDRAIFALGNSGDLQFYDWRFPLAWQAEIKRHAVANGLDPAWVFGTVRSESAMLETARSSANALGLMQVTPATGRRVARKHGLAWQGSSQLQTAEGNLPIGTAYMAELVREFSANPVLVSAAYNAGPNAVKKWLDSRPRGEAAVWIDTLPYFETRDYIPRVLAFSTLYAWRMGEPVTRISARMPDLDSGKIRVGGIAGVECQGQVE